MAYGDGDSTYQALGKLEGIRTLVEAFYRIMESTPDYRPLFDMHPSNTHVSIDKLVAFLSGWTGGERLFAKTYGQISLPQAHAHLIVTEKEKQMWLGCMSDALDTLDYPDDLKAYLIEKLNFPATRIHQVSQARHGHDD
ncbi:group II truncated hemoglobin [Marinomonas balearica]|uniref:Hemoglobin n=1 Tax=Marinomonas balearica TaxID=491947 RepID=A0A4R6MAV1_9GAMM|nr:group II truncated hemoglobin [Marinomonas balearica]TDO97359.1 hemoglobin [Marinomonas balearica]